MLTSSLYTGTVTVVNTVMEKNVSRAGRFELITTPESDREVTDLVEILGAAFQKKGRAKPPKRSEAIRYAIAFTHKQLTEVLNPEDLRDD